MIKIKQKWGLAFLLFLSLIYVIIYIFELNPRVDKVTEIYFADRITVAHRILIDQYNKENEGKVKVIPIDFPNYDFNSNERKELLARSLRGRGDGIDLFAVDPIWVQRFAKWCEPLDKYFPLSESSKIMDYALKSCYFDGELVSLPLNLVQGVMYYREDLIKQIEGGDEIIRKIKNNITWEEFISLKSKFSVENPYYIFPAADYEGLICSYMELILGLDEKYFENYGFDLNTPIAEKSLNLLVDLVNKYDVSPVVVTDFTEIPSYEYFIKNDGLFIRGWQSYDKDFLEAPFNPEKERNLRKAPIPHFADGNTVSVFGGWNLMMSKYTDKKTEVIKFIKFLLSESSQELFYREAGYYPIIRKFYEDEKYVEIYPEITQLKLMHQIGVHRPSHVEYTRYSKIMSHYIELAIRNEITVKEALRQTTSDIQNDRVIIKEF